MLNLEVGVEFQEQENLSCVSSKKLHQQPIRDFVKAVIGRSLVDEPSANQRKARQFFSGGLFLNHSYQYAARQRFLFKDASGDLLIALP